MQDISSLIKKSLEGSATAAELKQLLELLQQEETIMYAEWMQQKQATKMYSGIDSPAFDKQHVKQLVLQKIQNTRPAPAKVVAIKWYKRKLTIAAVVIACILTGTAYLLIQNDQQATSSKVAALSTNGKVIIEAGTGQKMILLQDSSIALIYPGSTLQYDNSYNREGRKLYLKGKGRFTVKKQQGQSFVVYGKHLSTTALGTVFEVTDNNDSTVVELIEGKVKVEDYTAPSARTVYLLKGQQATGSGNESIAVVQKYNHPEIALQAGEKKFRKRPDELSLSFRQTPLVQVFEVLKKKYKVNISFNRRSLSGMLFTGTFESGEQVEAILNVIAALNKLEVRSSQKGYKIIK